MLTTRCIRLYARQFSTTSFMDSLSQGLTDAGTLVKNGAIDGSNQLVQNTQYVLDQGTNKSLDQAIETLRLLNQKLVDADLSQSVQAELAINTGLVQVTLKIASHSE